MQTFKKILLPFLAFICVAEIACAEVMKVGLKQALDNYMVTLKATATSKGYSNKGLNFQIENKSGAALSITMDMGMILQPEDTSQQNLVLAGEEVFVVAPFKTASIEVQTFCAKSSAAAPATNMNFSYYKTGDESLVKVLRYIKNNRLYDALGQRAVWAMTDEKNLNGVYDPTREAAAKKLIEFMAELTKWPLPEYYTLQGISNQPGQPVLQPKNLKIYAQFEEKLDAPKTLSLGVYDGSGKLIQPVFENKVFGRTGHRWRVEFEAGDVEAGKYFIRLKEGETVLKEKMVEVD